MKKHLDIAKYDPYWKWAKKIRYILNWKDIGFTGKEITRLIIFQDSCLGYTNQGTVRSLESKTSSILKVYLDRGEVYRGENIEGLYTYKLTNTSTKKTTWEHIEEILRRAGKPLNVTEIEDEFKKLIPNITVKALQSRCSKMVSGGKLTAYNTFPTKYGLK